MIPAKGHDGICRGPGMRAHRLERPGSNLSTRKFQGRDREIPTRGCGCANVLAMLEERASELFFEMTKFFIHKPANDANQRLFIQLRHLTRLR